MRVAGLLIVLGTLWVAQAHAQAAPYRDAIVATATVRPAPPDSARAPEGRVGSARRFSSRAPGATLMIIGGAGILAGILVGGSGGTALIIGGVAVGAYGVYLYTQ